MIDKESSIPLHKQAEFYLRRLIEMDKYKNGKMIPNEIELSRQMTYREIHFDRQSTSLYTKGC